MSLRTCHRNPPLILPAGPVSTRNSIENANIGHRVICLQNPRSRDVSGSLSIEDVMARTSRKVWTWFSVPSTERRCTVALSNHQRLCDNSPSVSSSKTQSSCLTGSRFLWDDPCVPILQSLPLHTVRRVPLVLRHHRVCVPCHFTLLFVACKYQA